MRKYKDGEVRTYHGVEIRYHEKGQWYININQSLSGWPGKSRLAREYFKSIAEAKRYIDAF